MTKEEFKDLQLDMQQSGMSVTKYLQHVGINYEHFYEYYRQRPGDEVEKYRQYVFVAVTKSMFKPEEWKLVRAGA